MKIMKRVLMLIVLSMMVFVGFSQSEQSLIKTISVTGSSEMLVVPDEFYLVIGLEEYWEEEFERKNENKYKTKVPITKIEKSVIVLLENQGIKRDQFTLKAASSEWRKTGKEVLLTKELEVVLHKVSEIDSIYANIKDRGISFMKINEVNHSKIREYKKQVKIDALKAAKEKAEYLLVSIEEKLGRVMTVSEGESSRVGNFYMDEIQITNNHYSLYSDAVLTENFKPIKLSYTMSATFEIK